MARALDLAPSRSLVINSRKARENHVKSAKLRQIYHIYAHTQSHY